MIERIDIIRVRTWLSRHLIRILCLLFILSVPFFLNSSHHEEKESIGEATDQKNHTETEVKKTSEKESSSAKNSGIRKADYYAEKLDEKDIYSFSQGPYAWENQYDWSGAWCQEVHGGQLFSVFGCGLCAMANIYSTLTACDCSPVDMFEYAREVSGYRPVSGFGAIDWPYIRQTLRTTGIRSSIRRKDTTYEQFRKRMDSSMIAAIVLISSANDATYWQNVTGHYVTIWLYDREDETVFLTDSGNPARNRQRIPLRYVYDALNTSVEYQYLLVTAVDENGNSWKHDGIEADWRAPDYYRG